MAFALKELVGVELLFASVLGAGIPRASARTKAGAGGRAGHATQIHPSPVSPRPSQSPITGNPPGFLSHLRCSAPFPGPEPCSAGCGWITGVQKGLEELYEQSRVHWPLEGQDH